MRELRPLLWLQGVNALRLNELRRCADRKQRRRLAGMLFAYAFLALMALGYAGFFAWSLYRGGLHGLLPAYTALLAGVLSLMTAVARAHGSFFSPRGSEMLFSLPVRGGAILLSRLAGQYLSALTAALTVLLPGWVFYMMGEGFSAALAARLMLTGLLTPMLPMALGLVLGGLTGALGARLKHSGLITVLLTMAALTFFLVWVYTAPYDYLERQADLGELAQALARSLEAAWPPAGLAARAVREGGALTRHALLSLGAVALLWAALGPGYLRLLMWFGRAARAGRGGRIRARGPLAALTLKELRRLAASPLYLMNTAMMGWLPPAILLTLQLVKPGLLSSLAAHPAAAQLVQRLLPVIAAGFSSMGATTSVSLSMEGRSAWLMCTAPVSSRTLLLSKTLASLAHAWPASALTALMLTLLFRPGWLTALDCLLLPMALSLMSAVLGLSVDLRRARYDWESEQAIVKNSAQTAITVGSGMLTTLALAGLIYFSGALAPWAALLFALLIAALALARLRRLGRRPVYQIY